LSIQYIGIFVIGVVAAIAVLKALHIKQKARCLSFAFIDGLHIEFGFSCFYVLARFIVTSSIVFLLSMSRWYLVSLSRSPDFCCCRCHVSLALGPALPPAVVLIVALAIVIVVALAVIAALAVIVAVDITATVVVAVRFMQTRLRVDLDVHCSQDLR